MANTSDGSTRSDGNATSSWVEYWLQIYQPYERISHLIFKIASPVVLVIGIFGNFMVLLIMRRFTESSLVVFFQMLAWSDLILLTVGLLPIWLNFVFGAPFPEDLGTLSCKLVKVIINATGSLSAWALVALTMQRAASVMWPHRIGAVWTKTKSRIAAGILIAVITTVNSHYLIGFAYDEKECAGYVTKCCLVKASEAHRWFQNYLHPWLDLAEFCLVPIVLLIVSNSVLLRKLAATVRSDKHLPLQQSAQDSRQRNVSSLLVTLLSVSAAFFLLTAPIASFYTSVAFVITPTVGNWDPVLTGQYRIFEAVAHILWYSNSAVNFYLYCLTGRKFRAEFQNMAMGFFSLFHKTQKAASLQGCVQSPTVASSSSGTATDTMKGRDRRAAAANSDF